MKKEKAQVGDKYSCVENGEKLTGEIVTIRKNEADETVYDVLWSDGKTTTENHLDYLVKQ